MTTGTARYLIADMRRLGTQLTTNQTDIDTLLDEHGTRLRTIDSIGPVMAARLIGRTGLSTRFHRAATYATSARITRRAIVWPSRGTRCGAA